MWWPEDAPNDGPWAEHARKVVETHGRRLGGSRAQRWDPVVAATAITEALQVRTDAEQGLWCYDPQRGHYVDGERCEALIGRTLRWLVELWGPPTSRKGEVRKYGPNLRNEVRLILSEEPPSLVPGVPRNEFLLGFNNGILDVRKPEDGLTAHHPTSGITRVIPHDYNLDAEATLFLRLVAQVIPDEGERGLFQQACGVAMSELAPPQEMVVLVGQGGGGKTTCLTCLEEIIGAEHCLAISPKDIGESPFVKQQLSRGITANLPKDLSQMTSQDTAPFKEALGGDLMTGQVKHSNAPRTFRSRATWIGATNTLPSQKIDTTDGFYRRWLPVTAGAAIGEDVRVDDYARKLMAMPVEAQGFINWAIAGLAVFLGQGNLYKPPVSVLLHRDIWRDSGSPAAGFLATHIRADEEGFASRADLSRAFGRFLDGEGYPEVGKRGRPTIQGLYKEIRNRYPQAASQEILQGTSDRRGFLGISIRKQETALDDDDGGW